jgi:phosphoesterase RecJ-like protein
LIPELKKIQAAIEEAKNILIIQADNPDGDSLGSALALEQILGDMGKNPSLYCGVDIPYYLKFFTGWDRVSKDIPNKIDASIIVDTSSKLLLEQLEKSPQRAWVAAKPVIVLDHHINVVCDIAYASIVCNAPEYVSTGELIHEIAKQSDWPISISAGENITQSILSDSLGLTIDSCTAETYRRMAELIDLGVNRTSI